MSLLHLVESEISDSIRPDSIRPNGMIGSPQFRVDGLAKVTGRAAYGADHALPGAAYAYLATAPIARGKIQSIDARAARSMPGVLDILTYEEVGSAVKAGKPMLDGGYMSHAVAPLSGKRIHFSGQIVAVAVAESAEIAQAAAEAIVVRYKVEPATATLDSRGAKKVKPKSMGEPELKAGDVEKGLAEADQTVDAWYQTPAQHHNPMELFQATCAWEDDKLTVWESCQNVRGFQHGLAKQLGIKPEKIRVVSPYVGGAFGSRGELGQATALIAFAARRLQRPVKLVATRQQGFTLRTFRAETRHHLKLAADREGHLTALSHESWELTSRDERFAVAGSDSTARLYACPNVRTKVWNVEADRQAPGFMRAPPETPYLFALESAMDELAYKLKMDPLDLRRRNETAIETVTNKPYTSRSLMQCMERGAEVFGWATRDPRPGSMTDRDELVGWGYATAFYPTQVGPAQCTVTLFPDLRARVEVGTHEIGTGIRTVVAQTASDLLGLPLDAVEVCIGDSTLPAASMSAGSNSTASVCSVVAKACEAIRQRIASFAVGAGGGALKGRAEEAVRLVGGGAIAGEHGEPLEVAFRRASKDRPMVEEATNTPHGAPPVIGPMMVRRGRPMILGGSNLKDRMQFAFGAQFVEVRIDRWTGQIRVPRMVGVFAAGRIMNPRTAFAQLNGGQIWGISSALHEATELDLKTARYVNQDLAEYHVPVAADIGEVQTILLEEVDHLVNPLGIKGVGELGVTGVNAAIANAVFHATGLRIRKLPIRVGDLALGSAS
jgi:xanthine dehydrogenase YagR molybdenum-binding subunit